MLKDELGELSRMKSKRIVCALPIVFWYERNKESLQILNKRIT